MLAKLEVEGEYRMLQKLNKIQYSKLIDIASTHDCGCVYPLSVAEGIQEGKIYTGSERNYNKILFWVQSGFAYLSGNVDEDFLNDIYDFMIDKSKTGDKRFLLMSKNKYVLDYFKDKTDVVMECRYLFRYAGKNNAVELPTEYELKEINKELLMKIHGTIVPSLFWNENSNFLERGKGYCISRGDDIASWAFSAAVSTKEIDIGIETNPNYKKKGLGMIVASKMIRYTLEQGKNPVWACHCKNIASEKMAESLGFVKEDECTIIKVAN